MKKIDIPTKDEFIKGIKEFEKHEKRDAMYKVATFLISHFWGNPSDMADGLGVLLLTWNQAFYRYGAFNFDNLERCISRNFQKIENFRNRDISTLSNSDEDDIRNLFNQFLEALQIDIIKFSEGNKKRYTKKDFEELLMAWEICYKAGELKTIYESIRNNPRIKNAIEFIRGDKKEYIQIIISKLEDTEKHHLSSKNLIMRSPVAVSKALHLLAPKFFPLWDDRIAKAYGCYYNNDPAEKYIQFMKLMKKLVEVVRYYIDFQDLHNRTLLKLIDEYNYSKYTKEWI